MLAAQPITRSNSVISQGDVALNTDDIRNTFNLDGSGIKIGVISDSYNFLQDGVTAADDIRSGDLPGMGNPDGYTTPVQVLKEGSKGEDEGRAMLQIVHDIAPASELMFYGVSNEVEMAQAIDALVAAGADIIVDDMGFTNQPFFQDGIAAQAVNRVVEQGVVYFSAAGNDGQRSYESEFSNSGNSFTLDGVTYKAHDFNAGAGVDVFNQFSLDAGEKLGPLTLQWDEPFASVGNGRGATSDLDIFIVKKDSLNLSADDVVASSTDNNVGADPLETISFTNNTDSNQFYILMGKRVDSTEPNLIKYINFSNGADNFEYGHNSSTVFGHPNAEGAIAIGATSYNDTPEFGTSIPKAKSTSSVGGTPIFIAADGTPLDSPLVRQKPNLLATDGVNTTFFGSDNSSDSDGFPNFSGTSAAAPHAAGVAALMLQAAGGKDSLTPAEVRSILEETALDADFPGVDFKSGSGLIQASEAVELIAPQSAGVAENDTAITRVSRDGNNDFLGTLENDILTGSATSDVLLGAQGDDQLLGEAGDDALYGGQGNDILLGRQGNDLLSGNLGDDVLIGGEGNDRFDLSLQAGVDVIKDFTPGEDIIGLTDGLTFVDLTLGFENGSTKIVAHNQTLAMLDGLHSLTHQNFVSI
ncbi:S8 family serine peptidase [Limnoraphis robusta]|uniref:S8 family serine peptidase n=1 Tax=Limnoraphis robusta CCNP1315 TaxID=3110306 RepID=A0ABU5U0Z1_9CYAN|nr:S8 family serine peptidase [Limnoraphis robusta]MEA5519808.1 S8 family serine peptidase [Limnoraphis robusta CCNP1315]MEA5548151.1 S8 family serine peptidase [Limnoraphis robusta CCNP1324]